MIAKLQQKFPIGIGTTQWLDFLNEGFRKIDQMSKGGFIWQLKFTTVTLPAGAQGVTFLPADFDPGKKAVLQGGLVNSPLMTEIPYLPMSEFVNQQHFNTSGPTMFACWTFIPSFAFGPPTVYRYVFGFAPQEAFPIPGGGVSMQFFYHALNFAPFTAAATVFFPTPDQFDSLIMDLAEAEARREYSAAGWDKLAAGATQSIQEMIDTYRTDRYDLAGISDVVAQAQEKSAERDR